VFATARRPPAGAIWECPDLITCPRPRAGHLGDPRSRPPAGRGLVADRPRWRRPLRHGDQRRGRRRRPASTPRSPTLCPTAAASRSAGCAPTRTGRRRAPLSAPCPYPGTVHPRRPPRRDSRAELLTLRRAATRRPLTGARTDLPLHEPGSPASWSSKRRRLRRGPSHAGSPMASRCRSLTSFADRDGELRLFWTPESSILRDGLAARGRPAAGGEALAARRAGAAAEPRCGGWPRAAASPPARRRVRRSR